MFFFDFSNVFPLFLWLVPMTPSDGPGGNRYPPSPNCNTVHNPAKPPSRNTLSPRGERDLRTTVQLCPPDPLFSLRSHKATSQPAGLPFVKMLPKPPQSADSTASPLHLVPSSFAWTVWVPRSISWNGKIETPLCSSASYMSHMLITCR